ncbi:MAG: GDSL-type esterase/lipase family protein [Polaromonas sp.]|nr:GDSL-type esterase/lipase family protein [Polaromonas sp.]
MPDQTLFTRRKLLWGAAFASLALAGCSKDNKAATNLLSKDATILCLGDSLTFGYGATQGASFPVLLEQLTGHVVQNAGVNGDTAEGALQRLPALLQENKPGLVIVGIGGNDFLRGVPPARTKAALTSIVEAVKASGAKIVLVAEPRPVLMAAATGSLADHEVYAEVASETGAPLFSDAWSYVLSRAELRSDQIHANDEGYKVFAGKLNDWLREQKFVI